MVERRGVRFGYASNSTLRKHRQEVRRTSYDTPSSYYLFKISIKRTVHKNKHDIDYSKYEILNVERVIRQLSMNKDHRWEWTTAFLKNQLNVDYVFEDAPESFSTYNIQDTVKKAFKRHGLTTMFSEKDFPVDQSTDKLFLFVMRFGHNAVSSINKSRSAVMNCALHGEYRVACRPNTSIAQIKSQGCGCPICTGNQYPSNKGWSKTKGNKNKDKNGFNSDRKEIEKLRLK